MKIFTFGFCLSREKGLYLDGSVCFEKIINAVPPPESVSKQSNQILLSFS